MIDSSRHYNDWLKLVDRDLENIVDKVHAFARSHMNMYSDVMKKTYDQ
jgi:hypothetical protein